MGKQKQPLWTAWDVLLFGVNCGGAAFLMSYVLQQTGLRERYPIGVTFPIALVLLILFSTPGAWAIAHHRRRGDDGPRLG